LNESFLPGKKIARASESPNHRNQAEKGCCNSELEGEPKKRKNEFGFNSRRNSNHKKLQKGKSGTHPAQKFATTSQSFYTIHSQLSKPALWKTRQSCQLATFTIKFRRTTK
jgi:hypothetical protein